jgi:hypothetical protein
MIPSNPTVWIVLIVAVAVVVLYAMWKGRGFNVVKKKGSWQATLKEPERPSDVSVASGLEVGAQGNVGNITGVESAGSSQPELGKVEVANNAKVAGKTGNITGVSIKGSSTSGSPRSKPPR